LIGLQREADVYFNFDLFNLARNQELRNAEFVYKSPKRPSFTIELF